MFENDDGRLVLKLGREENWIREYTTQEIFTKSNLSPFVMFATTKGGKTTIGIDIVHECARAGFNHFNFITSSYNAPTNTVLRNNVLPQCVIQDEEDICYKLNKVWEESETTAPISPEIIINTAERIATVSQRDVITQFCARNLNNLKSKIGFVQKDVCKNDPKSVELLSFLRGASSPKQFMEFLSSKKEDIKESIKPFQELEVDYDGKQITCMKGLNTWLQDCSTKYKKFMEDYLDMARQILRNKIKAEIQKDGPQIIQDYFSSGKTTNKVVMELMPLIIEDRRLCLIIDDISHVLAFNPKNKINIDGQQMSYKDALHTALNKAFNKGRHLGTIFFGVHSIQTLDSTENSLISNVIINSQTNITKNMNKSLFIMADKARIQSYLDALNGYNMENGTYYMLVCYKEPSQSPDGHSQYVIFQAKEHNTPSFDYQSYKHAPFFYALAQEHAKKLAGGELQIQDEASSETEYKGDDEGGEDEYEEEGYEDEYEED